ncbi:hypothetical protein [Chryseobacterium sp. JV274]|uniref:hypothetical protein n=1 Tax=Chryseobacterium sp. JV274 TaxID=1932669 RepID=UPI0009841589|nr:hypothetical protein [Chryseobacterium sp. JV274]
MVNDNGVITDYIIVHSYDDGKCMYEIRKGVHEHKSYYSSSMCISGFGIISGASSAPSIRTESSEINEIEIVKKFFQNNLTNRAKSHLEKITYPTQEVTKYIQLSLF